MSEDPSIDVMEATMRRAENALADEVARAIFQPAGWLAGYSEARVTRWQWFRIRLGWRWLAAREWLAVHVLRVEPASDQEDW